MRPRVAGIVLAALGVLAPCAHAQADLRVMSFNIRYGTASDGEHRWDLRRDALLRTIGDHAPHVLGVQEALRFQLDEMRLALPAFRELGVGRDDGRTKGEYAAILVDTARFQVVEHGTFWLSDTPDVPGSMHWGNRITRITTWARLVDRTSADTVSVFNAHWDHESQPSRERSAAMLLDRVRSRAPRDAIIVMGDFNSDEQNPAFQRLVATDSGLRDSFRTVHPGASVVGTFNAFRGDSTGGKIDAILVGRGWSVRAAGIDRMRWGGRLASDHFAVWAVVNLLR